MEKSEVIKGDLPVKEEEDLDSLKKLFKKMKYAKNLSEIGDGHNNKFLLFFILSLVGIVFAFIINSIILFMITGLLICVSFYYKEKEILINGRLLEIAKEIRNK